MSGTGLIELGRVRAPAAWRAFCRVWTCATGTLVRVIFSELPRLQARMDRPSEYTIRDTVAGANPPTESKTTTVCPTVPALAFFSGSADRAAGPVKAVSRSPRRRGRTNFVFIWIFLSLRLRRVLELERLETGRSKAGASASDAWWQRERKHFQRRILSDWIVTLSSWIGRDRGVLQSPPPGRAMPVSREERRPPCEDVRSPRRPQRITPGTSTGFRATTSSGR